MPIDIILGMSRFLASADMTGKEWDIVIIEEGISKNGDIYYPFSTLKEAVPKYEGAAVHAYSFKGGLLTHIPEKIDDFLAMFGKSIVGNTVGYITDVKAGKIPGSQKMGLTGRFKITADWLANSMKAAWEDGIKDFLQFSHNVKGKDKAILKDGKSLREATSIERVDSIDVVSKAAAGGRFLRMVASLNNNQQFEETPPMNKRFLESLKGLLEATDKKLVEGIDFNALTAADVVNLIGKASGSVSGVAQHAFKESLAGISDLIGNDKLEDAAGKIDALLGKSTPAPSAIPTIAMKEAEDQLKKFKEDLAKAQHDLQKEQMKVVLARKLQESGLPQQAIVHLKESLSASEKILSETDIEGEIKKHRDYLSTLPGFKESGRPPSFGNVEVGKDARDRMIHALDGFFDNADIAIKDASGNLVKIPRFRTLREAYENITGIRTTNNADFARNVLFDTSIGYIPENYRNGARDPYGHVNQRMVEAYMSMKESLKTSDFGQILGDSVTRRMIKEYTLPQYNAWRLITSEILPLSSFRTQRRPRMGGYGDLPTVAEQGTYTELTSPGDEEVTYSPAKKGGLESITEEMLVNDDVAAIRRIPIALGRAAARTIYNNIFDMFKNNLEHDGSTAIASTARANYSTTALSGPQMTAVRTAMRNQTSYGGNDTLGAGNLPKILLVPSDLEEMAQKICNSDVFVNSSTGYSGGGVLENSTTPNIHKGTTYIVVDEWTDTNNYWAVSDPRLMPTVEVGFIGGQEEPELFVQDDPNNGSMFTADKRTFKIRHRYGYALLDYRSFYTGVVS